MYIIIERLPSDVWSLSEISVNYFRQSSDLRLEILKLWPLILDLNNSTSEFYPFQTDWTSKFVCSVTSNSDSCLHYTKSENRVDFLSLQFVWQKRLEF